MDYAAMDRDSRVAARSVLEERQSQTAERGCDPRDGFSLHGKMVSPLFGLGAALSEWSQKLQLKMETTWPLVKEGMPIRYVKFIAGGVLASVAAIYLWKLYRRLSVDSGEEFCKHKDNLVKGTCTSSKLSSSVLIEKRQVPRSPTTRVADMSASGVPVRPAPGDTNVCKSVAAGTPLQLEAKGHEDCPDGEDGGVDRYACSRLQQDPGAGDTGKGHSPCPQDDGMNRSSSMEADDQQTMSKSVAMATVSPNSLPTLLCSVKERCVMCVSAPATQELLRPCEVSATAAPSGAIESVNPAQSSNKEDGTPLSVSTTVWSTISRQPDLLNSSDSGMNRGSLRPTSPATTRAETRSDIQKNSSHNQAPPSPLTRGSVPVNVAIIDPDCNAVTCEGSGSCLGVGLDVTQNLGRPQGPQPLAQVAYTATGQAVGFHSLCAYASVQCAAHPSPSPARSVGGSHLDSPQNSVLNLQQHVLSDTSHVTRCQAESATSSRSLTQCESSAACCSLCAQTLHVHSPSVHVYLPTHARPHGSVGPAAAPMQCLTCSTHLSHHYQHLHAATPHPPVLPHACHSPSQRFSVAMPHEEHRGSAAAAACGPRAAPLQQYLHPDLFPAAAADVLACGACHTCPGSSLESASDGLRTRLTERGSPADAVQQAVILWRPPRPGAASSAGSAPSSHGYAPVVYPQPLLTGGPHFHAPRGSAHPASSPPFFLHHQRPAPFPPYSTTDFYLDGCLSYPAGFGEAFSSHSPHMVFREGSPQFFRY